MCRGKSLHLNCNHPDERLAIYSATFASAVGSHIYCPAIGETHSNAKPQNDAKVSKDDDDDYSGASSPEQDAVQKCEASFATEAVMNICHGKGKSRQFKLSLYLSFELECEKNEYK